MAAHWRMLTAYPNTRLLRMMKYGEEAVTAGQTDHFKGRRGFCDGPAGRRGRDGAVSQRSLAN